MSDGITDVGRDMQRRELERVAMDIELNRVLAGVATRKDIEDLVFIWEKWSKVPNGYWGASSKKIYEQRIEMYTKLLEDGQVTISIDE